MEDLDVSVRAEDALPFLRDAFATVLLLPAAARHSWLDTHLHDGEEREALLCLLHACESSALHELIDHGISGGSAMRRDCITQREILRAA